MRRFQSARFFFAGAGESAALVTEKLGFQQTARKRGAIDLDERLNRATGPGVDVESDCVFTNARLAGYQDVGIRAGNAVGETNRLAHRFRTRHNLNHDSLLKELPASLASSGGNATRLDSRHSLSRS